MTENRKTGAMAEIGRYLHISMQYIITVVALTLGGYWLDGKLGSSPWLLLVGLGLGFSAGFYNLYREVTGDRKR
jgi:F0F1-type ATP synthase assembly protein I